MIPWRKLKLSSRQHKVPAQIKINITDKNKHHQINNLIDSNEALSNVFETNSHPLCTNIHTVATGKV